MIEIQALASSSTGNCYRVTDGSASLLLECGIPIQQIKQGLGFKLGEVIGCLISHEHQDHCKAVKNIIKTGVDCYMSRDTADTLGLEGHRVKIIQAKQQFRLCTWTILPFDIVHDAAEPLGFLLANQVGEKLLYLSDTTYCRYRFQGLTHLMLESNYSLDILRENVANGNVSVEIKNRIIRTHFSLQNVKDFLKANDLNQVQEIWLLHLSNGNSDANRFKREIQELTGKVVYVA